MPENECKFGEALIEIKDVTHYRGNGELILKGVNQAIYNTIGHGQVVSFLGRSGIGKTTMFRLIAGLEKPSEGKVLINCNGLPNNAHETREGLVGVIRQDYPLFNHYTVRRNLAIAAAMKNGTTEAERKEKIDYFLGRFDLQALVDKFPAQLSGGQRQRIAIIQQILCSNNFILMDEPVSGLDIIAKEQVISLIKEASEMDELNTYIMITHDIPSAILASDTICLFGRGRDEQGNAIPGSFIKEKIDLIKEGLAWRKDLDQSPEFFEMVKRVSNIYKNL